MEPFLVSTAVVALAEIGDKTQLLALVLAARYRRPVPVILGILIATIVNHGLAGALGQVVIQFVGPDRLRWILAASFIAMAGWTLIPDKLEGEESRFSRMGAFSATLISFFLVEMGDKTQIATVALAARYGEFIQVVMGTTLGMMLANVPAVLIGQAAATRLPMRAIHVVAAMIFFALGVAMILFP